MVFPFGLFVRAIFVRYVKSMRKHSFGVATMFFWFIDVTATKGGPHGSQTNNIVHDGAKVGNLYCRQARRIIVRGLRSISIYS
jgi:hypothetical protein